MDPDKSVVPEQELEDAEDAEGVEDVQLRDNTRNKEVKFYLRDSNISDDGSIDSSAYVQGEAFDDVSDLPGTISDVDGKKANFKRKGWSLSVEKSIDIPDRTPSDDTLTSISSSSTSTLDHRSSDEMQRCSVLSSMSSNSSSGTKKKLQRGNSEDEAFSAEGGDAVPDILHHRYRRMSSDDRRDAYRKASMESDGKSSGIFSGSRSSSQLNPNSTSSLPGLEADGVEADTKKIVRNASKIIEEIDPAAVLGQMHKEGSMDSDTMIAIEELPSRKERAIALLLLVLTSGSRYSTFYPICYNNYKQVFENFNHDKPSSVVLTHFCKNCSEIIMKYSLSELESLKEDGACINSLLFCLMEEEFVSPDDIKHVYRKPLSDKFDLLTRVAEQVRKQTRAETSNNAGNFLWAMLSSRISTSKDYTNNLFGEISNCQICREVLKTLRNKTDALDCKITSSNDDIEEQPEITVYYHDLSTGKGEDQIVLIKLETKDDVKVKQIFSRKKDKFNKDIGGIAKIEDVIIGSVILKLTFNEIDRNTEDTYCKLEKVLQTLLSEQEITHYLHSGKMEITVSVSDRITDIDDYGDVLNQKLTIILNMTALLEELDAINFKQYFIEKRIMSDEEFQRQFKVKDLGRKDRTSRLLKYVLNGNADVMNVFLEVIETSYSFLGENLKQRKFIGFDGTEVKQYAFSPRKAMQHNELANQTFAAPELDVSSIEMLSIDKRALSHIENNDVEINSNGGFAFNAFMQMDSDRMNSVNGENQDVNTSDDNPNVRCSPHSGQRMDNRVVHEVLREDLLCRGYNNSPNQNSQTPSDVSSSGPKEMLCSNNTKYNSPQTPSDVTSSEAKDMLYNNNTENLTAQIQSDFHSCGPEEMLIGCARNEPNNRKTNSTRIDYSFDSKSIKGGNGMNITANCSSIHRESCGCCKHKVSIAGEGGNITIHSSKVKFINVVDSRNVEFNTTTSSSEAEDDHTE